MFKRGGNNGDAPNEGDLRVNLVTSMCQVTIQRGPPSPAAIYPRAAAVPGGALALSRRQCAFTQKSPELGKKLILVAFFFVFSLFDSFFEVRWTDQNGTLCLPHSVSLSGPYYTEIC